jgi:hypothetical protein
MCGYHRINSRFPHRIRQGWRRQTLSCAAKQHLAAQYVWTPVSRSRFVSLLTAFALRPAIRSPIISLTKRMPGLSDGNLTYVLFHGTHKALPSTAMPYAQVLQFFLESSCLGTCRLVMQYSLVLRLFPHKRGMALFGRLPLLLVVFRSFLSQRAFLDDHLQHCCTCVHSLTACQVCICGRRRLRYHLRL